MLTQSNAHGPSPLVPPQPRGEFAKAKTAFCIHNIAFQGRFPDASFGELNLPGSAKGAFAFADSVPYDKAAGKASGKFAKINWMKAGFMTADKLLTVSPTYASEVSANAEKGVELDVVIRAAGGIEGIVNGMDASEWHPKKDKYLDVKYDASTVFQVRGVEGVGPWCMYGGSLTGGGAALPREQLRAACAVAEWS